MDSQIVAKEEQPKAKRSIAGIVSWTVLGVVGIVYLVNPGAGVIEAIPDNVPVAGNLDEATATFLVLSAIEYLTGWHLSFGRRRLKRASKKRRSSKDSDD